MKIRLPNFLSETARLRRRAQNLAIDRNQILYRYSCGATLAGYINPRVNEITKEIQEIAMAVWFREELGI